MRARSQSGQCRSARLLGTALFRLRPPTVAELMLGGNDALVGPGKADHHASRLAGRRSPLRTEQSREILRWVSATFAIRDCLHQI